MVALSRHEQQDIRDLVRPIVVRLAQTDSTFARDVVDRLIDGLLTPGAPEGVPSHTSRVLREDIVDPNVLHLGTEFGYCVSLDRGETWHRMNGELPTVAVHEVAQHAPTGDIVLATATKPHQ